MKSRRLLEFYCIFTSAGIISSCVVFERKSTAKSVLEGVKFFNVFFSDKTGVSVRDGNAKEHSNEKNRLAYYDFVWILMAIRYFVSIGLIVLVDVAHFPCNCCFFMAMIFVYVH